MKRIWVGDPHMQPSNLNEGEKLLEFIERTAVGYDAEEIVFAGDLFHTHAVIRMEVLEFWMRWGARLSEKFDVIMLVGNHDMLGDKERETTMSALSPLSRISNKLQVVWKPMLIKDAGYIPYTSSHDNFYRWANTLYEQGAKLLFCHQTFQGSRYDNGFYAPDGIDTTRLPPFVKIISGHIHTQQEMGTVFYPGTPKWDSVTDANQEKGIWVMNGSFMQIVGTDRVCSPILKFTVNEGSNIPEIPEGSRTHIELVGTKAWVTSQLKKLKGKCKVSVKPTDAALRANASQTQTFDDFFKSFKFNGEVQSDTIRKYLESI